MGQDARTALVLRAGVVGVWTYVLTWFALGLVRDGYDPLRQAISELFDLGAPRGQALLLSVVLALTGLALVPFGIVLDRTLPGTGRLGPSLVVLSGVGTFLVAFAPCTAGCPGIGASLTDTLHVVFAGGGYVALVTSPLAVAHRVRDVAPRLARWSLLLGGVATVGFVVRNLGVDTLSGLQQRVFNTTADVWIALVAVDSLRRHRASTADSSAREAASASAQRASSSDSTP